MPRVPTVLVIPPNDPEAVLIAQLARAMGLQLIRSAQPHGATLDKEPEIVQLIRDGGWKKVVVVEMPGPKTETKIRALGVELVIIDHHRYTGLDRAHDPKTRKLLPSSIEQFRKHFKLTPARLKKLGFDARLVEGTGVMDRGFVWALMDAGFKKREIAKVVVYQRELMSTVRDMSGDARKDKIVEGIWKRRKKWKTFWIIDDSHDLGIRARISNVVALDIGKPTALIIVERKRGFIYVQESPYAIPLFEKFGGFTFGLDRNWGQRRLPGKPMVSLKEVKSFLEKLIK